MAALLEVRYGAELQAETGRLAEALHGADPATRVPTCPEWNLAQLATLSGDHVDPIHAGLRGDGQILHFHAADVGLGEAGEWLVRRDPAGVVWEHGHGRADVAVRGRALDLLLVLTRRAAPADTGVKILGDRATLTDWLEHGSL